MLASACQSQAVDFVKPAGSAACQLALAPHHGKLAKDQEVAHLRDLARRDPGDIVALIRLGWALTSKAHQDYDSGYFKLAEQAALCAESRRPDLHPEPDVLLLLGHSLQSMHRFEEAEVIARQLIALRGSSADWGLLGDAMVDRGDNQEAALAYQAMHNKSPDLKALNRLSFVSWMQGQLDSARNLLKEGLRLPDGDPASQAWALARLARIDLQEGNLEKALDRAQAAFSKVPGYVPALQVKAQVLLAQHDFESALPLLLEAVQIRGLPDGSRRGSGCCGEL